MIECQKNKTKQNSSVSLRSLNTNKELYLSDGRNCPWSHRRFRIRTNHICGNVSKCAHGFPSLFHFDPFLFFIFSECGVVTTRGRQLASFFSFFSSSNVCVESSSSFSPAGFFSSTACVANTVKALCFLGATAIRALITDRETCVDCLLLRTGNIVHDRI